MSRNVRLCGLLLCACAAGVALAAGPAAKKKGPGVIKERINPSGLHKPNGYAHVATARGGKTVYVSGQLALDASGNLVGPNDIEKQTRQAFLNLRTALEAAGGSFDDVVKLNSYVVGLRPAQLDAIRAVRKGFLGEVAVPASTLVGVQALAREGCLIEIDAVAVVE